MNSELFHMDKVILFSGVSISEHGTIYLHASNEGKAGETGEVRGNNLERSD